MTKRVPSSERENITEARLKELFSYDPAVGVFIRVSVPRPQLAKLIGSSPGYIKPGSPSNGGGYVMIPADGKTYRAHRLAWLYMTGEWPVVDVDHINGVRADNRWANLRLASRSQNLANARGHSDSLTGIKGVTYDKARGRWRAQVDTKFIGRFDTADEAAAAYLKAAEALYGEFARAA